MELIGAVPSVDVIEKATPSDIINRPTANEQSLLSIELVFHPTVISFHLKIAYKNAITIHI